MRHRWKSILGLVMSLICFKLILADNNQPASNSLRLPPIETFVIEPIELENVSTWVPAAKIGPRINRSCRANKNCSYSSVLPATVHHSKTELCPKEVARLLAEYTACYHEQSMPLTIFNGWQWEYSYSLCQFESGTYDLPGRGGSWENSWEAILTQSAGSACFQRMRIAPSGALSSKANSREQKSSIEVKTFSFMRTRDGYPKKWKL